jgi:hypothetical protein
MSSLASVAMRALLLVTFAIAILETSAQTTIFNIPSADTQPRGSWGFEVDLVTKPVQYRDGGYQTYGYRVSYGVRRRTELGANFYLTYNGQSTAQAEFSVKQNVMRSEKYGVSVSAGAIATVPLRSRGADRTAIIIYANASKTIEPLNGMTVTGGVYHVFRGSRDFGTRTGAMAAVVQPINEKFSLVADWFTGNNRLGYASGGLNYNITKKQYLLTGYSFGNSGRGNNALAAYYGFTF